MTIFTCSVCGKSTQIDTTSSLVFTNCLLTAHCSGRLYRNANASDGAKVTSTVNRYKLEILTQPLLSKVWVSSYRTTTIPYVLVYQLNANGGYTQLKTGFSVSINSSSNLVITLNTATSGVAHIISNTSFKLPELVQPDTEYVQLSANSILTIASNSTNDTITKVVTYTDPETNSLTTSNLTFTAHKSSIGVSIFNTPWKNVESVILESKPFRVFSCNISQSIPNIQGIKWTIDFGTDIHLLSMYPFLQPQDCELGMTCVSQSSGVFNPPNLWVEGSQLYRYYPLIKFKKSIFD